ncbi:phosphatase inhibitor-domain-containing protein [Dichotomopilus funicola]|uniref:Type 1 phosphatases regulator n=1 Tax=Dichotomopilus funicola TaxID=1934379 RepID=A0AAN6UYC3_9PEZI|nr:phosphatase inhibitor-domain-containing protein [Dichotomopilus funicola]
MAPVPQSRQQQAPRPAPSQTETTSSTSPQTHAPPQAILRLRGAHAPTRRSVQWSSDVVDNEGLGRKKSKVCCIYHRPRGVDESSDESSSDSSDSDSESDGGRRGDSDHQNRGNGHNHNHNHGHDHECDGHHTRRGRGGEGSKRRPNRQPSPNAYEKMPKYDVPRKDGGDGGDQGKGKGKGMTGS